MPTLLQRVSTPASQTLKAIGLMILALLLLSLMDTVGKVLSSRLPVQQVVWGRYFFQVALLLLLIPSHGMATLLRTQKLGTQVVRGVLLALATICLFTALQTIPLADAYTITFTAPFMVTLLSIPMLGERVGWRRWSAIFVGFIGVLVVIRPGFASFQWVLLLPLVAAACFALYQVLTRQIGKLPSENPLAMLFYMALVGTVIQSVIVTAYWQPLDGWAWAGMVAMGALAAVGHLLMIQALALASAVTLAPFTYTPMVWAIVIGYLVFGDVPDRWMVLGAAIIIGSGLFVYAREARRG